MPGLHERRDADQARQPLLVENICVWDGRGVGRRSPVPGKDASQADDGHRVEDGGAAIVSEGDKPKSVYLVKSGRVTMLKRPQARERVFAGSGSFGDVYLVRRRLP